MRRQYEKVVTYLIFGVTGAVTIAWLVAMVAPIFITGRDVETPSQIHVAMMTLIGLLVQLGIKLASSDKKENGSGDIDVPIT